MLWSDVWQGETALARAAQIALTPASWLYAGGWNAYLACYALGLRQSKELHQPVVCVGNLTAGGSGKTPFTLWLAKALTAAGRQVVVGCSGYGSPAAEAAKFAPDGPISARDWGDEPAMFRWLAPELPLVVGRRRTLAAELCSREYPHAALVMDDGFQHLPLRKHVSIVLDDEFPTNTKCLPAGPYREPRGHLARADLVIPGRFSIEHRFAGLVDGQGNPVTLQPRSRVRPLCAIGRPDRFLASLSEAGFEVDRPILLPDHDRLEAGNLFASIDAGDTVVATAKDWVKLRERADLARRTVLVAAQETRVEPGQEFLEWIDRTLNEVASQAARS